MHSNTFNNMTLVNYFQFYFNYYKMKTLLYIFLLLISVSFASICVSQETRGTSGIIVSKKSDVVAGNTYAIIVGISDYPNLKPLHFADKDAELFRDYLEIHLS